MYSAQLELVHEKLKNADARYVDAVAHQLSHTRLTRQSLAV